MSVLPPVCEVMQMTVTVEEMKSYLRVDFEDDDALIENFISAAKKQCMDILRTDDGCLRWHICMSTGRKLIIMRWI